MNRPTTSRLYALLPALLVTIIGVCYAVITSSLNYLGDDLSYYMRTEPYAGSDFYLFPRHIAATWLGANGRLQNVIAPALFHYVPGVVLCVLNGLMTALYFWLTLKWCRPASVAVQVAIIALLAFAMPWWDMFLLFVVNIGYTWGMALTLLFLWIFFHPSETERTWAAKAALAGLGILTGGMHEGSSVPLCASLAIFLLYTRGYRRIGGDRKLLLAGLVAGTLYCILSPGIWMRAAGEKMIDGPWWWLIGCSSYFVLALVAAVVVCLFWRREALARLVRGPWAVFVMMALMSLPIVVFGGIVGRPGFFGQTAALIALVMLLKEVFPRMHPGRFSGMVAAFVLSVAVVFHYVEFVRYQLRLNDEVRQAVAQYLVSDDGAVYMDYTSEPDMPFYLLRKTRGVPDEDDIYLCTNLTRYRGSESRPFTVLPEALRGVNPDTLSGDLLLPKGYLTLRTPGTEMPESDGRRLISLPEHPDSIAVPVPGSRAFYVTQRDLDPYGSY